MSLGKNIRALRKAQGLTQEALGNLMGTTKQSISAWEDGKFVPNYDNIKKLAKALNVQVTDLESTQKQLNQKVKEVMTEIDSSPTAAPTSKSNARTHALYASYVRFVPVAARAGYIGGIPNPVHEDDLVRAPIPIYLPNPDNYLAFEIDGDSMLPRIAEGDIVICKSLPFSSSTIFHRHKLFVIVMKNGHNHPEGGIICKQLEKYDEKAQKLIFTSLNPDYPGHTIALKDVAQLWYVKHVIHVETF